MKSLTLACMFLGLLGTAAYAADEVKPEILPVLESVNGEEYGITALFRSTSPDAQGTVSGYVSGPNVPAVAFAAGEKKITRHGAGQPGYMRYIGYNGTNHYGLTVSGKQEVVQVVEIRTPNQQDQVVLEVGPGGAAVGAMAPGNVAYLVRASDGHLLRADLGSKAITDLGTTAEGLPFQPEKRRLPKAIALAPDGSIFTSGKNGALIKVRPAGAKIESTGVSLPCVPGREAWANVDALLVAPDGTLYGATGDGYLFHYDPRSNRLRNLGKPLRQGGVPVLLWGPDGNILGVGGEAEGMPHFFQYRPASGDFTLGGIPGLTSRSSGAPISCGVFDTQGRLFVGQAGRLASVLVYAPGAIH